MNLPKTIAIALILAMALIVPGVAAAGNGIDLNGQHYNLNLIGGKFPKNWAPTQDSNSHVIFVAMGNGERLMTQIYLTPAPEGESFDVLDGNGVDGVARFQLPKPYVGEDDVANPDPCTSAYQVYVRVNAGKGSGSIQTVACDDTNADGYCTIGTDTYYRGDLVELSKNNKFQRVTHQLTTVDIGGASYGLFSDQIPTIYGIDLYFWELMNDGLKNIQLRFYPTPADYCTAE